MNRALLREQKKKYNQFFTPPTIAGFMAKNTRLDKGSKIADPSAGDGIFIDAFKDSGFSEFYAADIDKEITTLLRKKYGIDKKIFIINKDALDITALEDTFKEGTFDAAVGNPPFSNQKNKISDPEILKHYELGRKKQSAEILFLERFIRLLKPGGKLRVILPVNIFSNTNLQYVRDFIISQIEIEAIVNLPKNVFYATSARTVILFGIKKPCKTIEKIKMINFSLKTELQGIDKINIDNYNKCVHISPHSIGGRLDPDYYFIDENIEKTLKCKRFNLAPLSSVSTIRSGFYKYDDADNEIFKRESKGRIRLIKAKNIKKFGFDFTKCSLFIDRCGSRAKEKAFAAKNDVLFVRVGEGCIGRVLSITSPNFICQPDDWFFIIRPKNISSEYIAFYLSSNIGSSFINREKQGTGTVSISKKRLGNIPIPLLPKEKEEEFAKGIKKVMHIFEISGEEKAEEEFKKLDSRFTKLILGDNNEIQG